MERGVDFVSLLYACHSRCSSVVRRLRFRRSTSLFRKRMCRIMFSGESISMEMSRGEGGADTGWSSFSCRILKKNKREDEITHPHNAIPTHNSSHLERCSQQTPPL